MAFFGNMATFLNSEQGNSFISTVSNFLTKGTQLYAGMQESKSYRKQAEYRVGQARVIREDTVRNAEIHKRNLKQFESEQRMAFLKSGVSLEGSPLLILEETERIGKEELKAMLERGKAKQELVLSEGEKALGVSKEISRGMLIKEVGDTLTSFLGKGK